MKKNIKAVGFTVLGLFLIVIGLILLNRVQTKSGWQRKQRSWEFLICGLAQN
jgi:hypothetical protein